MQYPRACLRRATSAEDGGLGPAQENDCGDYDAFFVYNRSTLVLQNRHPYRSTHDERVFISIYSAGVSEAPDRLNLDSSRGNNKSAVCISDIPTIIEVGERSQKWIHHL